MASTPNLRAALAGMISDYRKGEIPTADAAHVDRWIAQFPASVRDPILSELLHVFRWTYFNRANVQTFIDNIVTNANFVGPNPSQFWQGVKVLNLQTAGNSQKDMIALLAESLQRQCGLALASCGAAPQSFLYLDDALFSGAALAQISKSGLSMRRQLKRTWSFLLSPPTHMVSGMLGRSSKKLPRE